MDRSEMTVTKRAKVASVLQYEYTSSDDSEYAGDKWESRRLCKIKKQMDKAHYVQSVTSHACKSDT